MPHYFHPSILREYDIRGIYGKTLFDEDAFALGVVLAGLVKKQGGQKVVVGYDGRTSSPVLAEKLMQGFMAAGMAADSVGMGPTPRTYFSVFKYGYDGGVMVTGSHNPGHYNGFKMMVGQDTLHGAAITALGAVAAGLDLPPLSNDVPGYRDVDQDYIERLLEDLPSPKPLNIAWDAGNGAAGPLLEMFTQRLPGQHTLLYTEVDGRFPNHHPDPTVEENLADLKKAVRDHNLDLGIAFDGDGDRIGLVDDRGEVLWADQLIALYAREVLGAHPGAAIIAEVKCSQVLFNEIERCGGRAIMAKAGHSIIKAKMKQENAPLAGEMSGHIFFSDKYYGFDDALYAAVRLLHMLSQTDKKLSEIRQTLPTMVNTPEIRFDVPEERKFEVISEISERLKQTAADVVRVDGVRVTSSEGWWLLRASNTQSMLSARVEANSEKALKKLVKACADQLALSGITLPKPVLK